MFKFLNWNQGILDKKFLDKNSVKNSRDTNTKKNSATETTRSSELLG